MSHSEHHSILQELSGLVGLAGYEGGVGRRVHDLLAAYCAEVRTDTLGNCIALRPGEGPEPRPRIMVAAHMDEIGLMVSQVDKGGFLRCATVGGVDPRNLLGTEVIVHGRRDLQGYLGLKPPHLTSPDERDEAIPLDELFIDVGLPEPEVRQMIRPGDLVSMQREPISLQGSRVAGKALDNRASITALLIALGHLTRFRHAADVYAVATVQEEVGLRGAMVSAYGLAPDAAVALDVNFGDMPGVADDKVSRLGKGPAIARGANVHPGVGAGLLQTAQDNHIPHQTEVIPGASGTDAWAIQVARAGIPTGLVSIPLRYMHSTVETVDLEDIEQTGLLLATYIAGLTRSETEGWTDEL